MICHILMELGNFNKMWRIKDIKFIKHLVYNMIYGYINLMTTMVMEN
jgi:hypothetical protein